MRMFPISHWDAPCRKGGPSSRHKVRAIFNACPSTYSFCYKLLFHCNTASLFCFKQLGYIRLSPIRIFFPAAHVRNVRSYISIFTFVLRSQYSQHTIFNQAIATLSEASDELCLADTKGVTFSLLTLLSYSQCYKP